MGNSGGGESKASWVREHPEHDRFVGLTNFGNTCYANSSLQALYFCVPFRMAVVSWFKQELWQRQQQQQQQQDAPSHAVIPPQSAGFWATLFRDDAETNRANSMLEALAELWEQITVRAASVDRIEPRRFINTLRALNVLFRSPSQQDAHEFLFFLLNDVAESLEKAAKAEFQRRGLPVPQVAETFVHTLFQGKLVTKTQCLTCEHSTFREESFLDLGLEIEEHMSLTACLKKLQAVEVLHGQDKFFCDHCNSLQEAKKQTKLRQIPRVLVLHFKRFKVLRSAHNRVQYSKLCYRIPFPLDIVIDDESGDAVSMKLFAVVIHIGTSASAGHYVTAARCRNTWLLIDDDHIRPVDADQMASLCFGQYHRDSPSSATAYILFFERT